MISAHTHTLVHSLKTRDGNRIDDFLRYLLGRIYTGDFFACDFFIKIDVAKLHLFNNGFHCDENYLTAENDCQVVSIPIVIF